MPFVVFLQICWLALRCLRLHATQFHILPDSCSARAALPPPIFPLLIASSAPVAPISQFSIKHTTLRIASRFATCATNFLADVHGAFMSSYTQGEETQATSDVCVLPKVHGGFGCLTRAPVLCFTVISKLMQVSKMFRVRREGSERHIRAWPVLRISPRKLRRRPSRKHRDLSTFPSAPESLDDQSGEICCIPSVLSLGSNIKPQYKLQWLRAFQTR